ncbi:hypothetical protein [Bordetella sp. BOR01]|uniref:hypothetical protein n=1 Tax=Bordetella sp. BOR01 TaxID=2854779 RepID=UPI001C466BF9|nr:hypothetical protein [Bordetella sp. BOR01]MBV7485810.1 hypothetical protein [Bordetella sp. BOR01]
MANEQRYAFEVVEDAGRYRWRITTMEFPGTRGQVDFSDEDFATEDDAREAGRRVLEGLIEG